MFKHLMGNSEVLKNSFIDWDMTSCDSSNVEQTRSIQGRSICSICRFTNDIS